MGKGLLSFRLYHNLPTFSSHLRQQLSHCDCYNKSNKKTDNASCGWGLTDWVGQNHLPIKCIVWSLCVARLCCLVWLQMSNEKSSTSSVQPCDNGCLVTSLLRFGLIGKLGSYFCLLSKILLLQSPLLMFSIT